ncbi:serpin peptidase inhibitor, clade F (alpha-2 antiplasmin, pigment epithelium derived factor), member 2b [Scleropages formosus]|uniref:Serpin domain-containing protein n=1 Tax=Scleropages formosus TaxID=113540 RepID=A0A8C9VAP5_SCLFO|nr:alpha-2-antiplasmin-like [Scleropages formosus]
MDLRLVSLLLITLGGQALSELDTTLFPTTVLPSDTAVTSSDPDYSYKPTTERNTTLQPEEEEEDSSEELVEGGCAAYISSDKAKQALGDAVMKFGLQLLKNLKKDPDEPNVIVSPLSVSLALSQLALGAEDATESQLLKALHADGLPCYRKALRGLLHHLRSHALQVVSRMYLKPGFEVKKAFVEESQRLYKSYPATLTGLEEINEWVKEATKGQVTDFLSSLPPNLVLLLINAVHFKGEWEARFDPHFTSTELFHVDAKHMVKVDMMHGPKYPLSQMMHNELDAQVARFPFLGHMSLLIVMPLFGEVNIAEIAAKLNISDLYAHLPEKRNMQVQLPRFKLQYSQELQQALTSMGLGELFSGPNLPRIADGVLLVSSVQHKSSMELNEEGAEAAAATSVAILRSSSSFCVNQPFFFALLDDITQAPIFLGVITNPNPGAPLVQRSPERGDSNKGDKNGLYEKRPPK